MKTVFGIVKKILQTNQLFATTQDVENERGFETIISYKEQQTVISYQGLGADRDSTIKALNDAVRADSEIRILRILKVATHCASSRLVNKLWFELETKFPSK
jgi:hypothetical protein